MKSLKQAQLFLDNMKVAYELGEDAYVLLCKDLEARAKEEDDEDLCSCVSSELDEMADMVEALRTTMRLYGDKLTYQIQRVTAHDTEVKVREMLVRTISERFSTPPTPPHPSQEEKPN